jgi:DNA polymerase-3 subunit gamma/tau
MSIWNKLAEKIKEGMEEGSSIVYAAMSTHTPILNDKFQIQLKVDNLSQEEEVRVFRTEIHSYLRKELRNGAIELLTKIIKDKKEKKAYTPEEKFNKLAEDNPTLLRLKKELDLDFF